MELDIIIKGGTVVDGTGAPRFKADVGIKGDTIVSVGDLSAATAKKVVDATGQVVTPGFIDMHSHSDQTIAFYPKGQSSVGQGITTTVGGQCGFSPAPLNKHYTTAWWEGNWWDKVEHRKYYPEIVGCLDKARQAAKETDGLIFNWNTFGEWIAEIEKRGLGLNTVPLVGHGTIRSAVMGQDYRREATPAEVAKMVAYAEQAIDEGAAGISNGMDYAPNGHCAVEESYAVIGVAAKKGKFFSTHWRRTGLREGFGNFGLVTGLKEAVDIAKKTGVKMEVAHLGSGWLFNPAPTPKLAVLAAEETLAVLDQAVADGVDLAFDEIPNHNHGGVGFNKYLASALSPWLKESGSLEQLSWNLTAPDYRSEIRDYIMAGKWFYLNPLSSPGLFGGMKISKSKVAEFVGKSIADIAATRKQLPIDAMMDVIQADPYAQSGNRGSDDDEVKKTFYKHPLCMVGCDTFLVDQTYGVRVPAYMLPNPNTFSGMARYIRLYANGLLGLEEGVRRITGLAANRLGLSDRGVVATGKKADLVIMKPEAVFDKFDGEEPRQYPDGYSWVFVNGTPAMENGKLTLAVCGRVLS